MNEIDKLFADVDNIPIINLDLTEKELKQSVKEFEAMELTPKEEAELEENIRNGKIIF